MRNKSRLERLRDSDSVATLLTLLDIAQQGAQCIPVVGNILSGVIGTILKIIDAVRVRKPRAYNVLAHWHYNQTVSATRERCFSFINRSVTLILFLEEEKGFEGFE